MKSLFYLVTTVCVLFLSGCEEKREVRGINLFYDKIPSENNDSYVSAYSSKVFFLQIGDAPSYGIYEYKDVNLEITLWLEDGTIRKGKKYWANWKGYPREIDISQLIKVEKCVVKGTCTEIGNPQIFQCEWVKK